MKRQSAEQLNLLAIDFGRKLAAQLEELRAQTSDAEFRDTASRVGRVLGALVEHLHEPIYREHPDLKPRELGGPYVVREPIAGA